MKRQRNAAAVLFVVAIIICAFTACSGEQQAFDWQEASWEEIVSQAEGTEVSLHMWGGSSTINAWIQGFVAELIEERHGIALQMVPTEAPVFVNRLLAEHEAGRDRGSIDLMWINGENFKRAKEAEVLAGPIVEKLPNFNSYVDPAVASHDFGYPTDGYEAPYGRAQFVFEYDAAAPHGHFASYATLPQWVRENPGLFTYPEPSDFTGSAFIRQAYLALNGGPDAFLEGWDPQLYAETSPRLWQYLDDIAPYLWQEGRSYPRELAVLDTLFERGEVAINMSYTQANAQQRILEGRYPHTVRSFVPQEGSVFGTHFTAMAFNAPNPAGALVLANLLLDPLVQASKNDPANWGDFTVLELDRLSPEDQARFTELDLGAATLSLQELEEAAIQEIPAEYIEALQDDWYTYVLAD